MDDLGGKKGYLSANYAHKRGATSYDYLMIEHILDIGYSRNGGVVLDLACGTGSFKPIFEGKGFNYHGIDLDNNDPLNNILNCDIADAILPFADETFDLVFFKMGIEHLTIKEISHCLAQAKRVMKFDAKLIVITPDWRWTCTYFYDEYTHQTPFTPISLESALKMAGFKCDVCRSWIQLPLIWRWPILKYVCDFASLIYPIFGGRSKFVKFSQLRAVLAIAQKT